MAVADGWVELGDRVFVRRYEFYDQNIGVVLGDGEALVIDTRSTYRQAREIVDHLRELTALPVTVVVDTHGHFDHAFGNARLPAGHDLGPRALRHVHAADRRSAQARDRPRANPTSPTDLAEVVIDPPDRTFDDTATIEVGGRAARAALRRARPHRPRHPHRGPGTDVLFAGDLVEQGNVPFFGDGYPLDWVGTSATVASLVTGTIVPGHGDHAGRAFADAQATSIARLVELARDVHAGTMTLDDAIAAHPFPELPPEHARAAFERSLAQLRGELD